LTTPSPDKPEPKSVRLVREITKYKSQITNIGHFKDFLKYSVMFSLPARYTGIFIMLLPPLLVS
jgi:hypothetical protein